MHKIIVTFVTLLVASTAFVTTASAGQPDRLVGEWFQGDGRAENITLILKRDFKYEATWSGCMGTYGTVRGTWRLDKSVITLTPTNKETLGRESLRTLDVRPSSRSIVLVQPKNRREYNQWGYEPPFPFWCFIRCAKSH